MENYIVYKITNLINGKLYIGQTIRTLEERFKAHYYDDESNIGNAIRQYGRENFTIEVIEKCDSKEELNAYENYYIAYFDSKEPKGYNQIGGDIDAIYKYNNSIFGKGGEFMAIYQAAFDYIGNQKELTGETLRVFIKLLSKLDFDNYIRISQSELAKEMNITRPNVTKAIKKLQEFDIIREGARAGLSKTYRLNPSVGHKGKHYEDTVIEFSKLQSKKKKKRE